MKNYKLIENRPELTKEQITQGMDFNKIKNDAALVKSTFLKLIFIKGLLGIIAVSVTVFIYKNYRPYLPKKMQPVFADTTKKINQYPKSAPVNYAKRIVGKGSVSKVEHKIMSNNSVIAPPLVKDTNEVNSATGTNQEIKEHVNTNANYSYPDDQETRNTDHAKSFTIALGQDDMKEIGKSFAKISENLYASKYEVSNKLYVTFLNSLKQSDNKNLLSVAEIDTVKWRDPSNYNEPYVHYYHRHPAYANFPVVNISYEAAKLFCEWLTVQYNTDTKRKFKKVSFRLPSEEEWIMAAQAGNSAAVYAWEGKELHNKKGQMMANFKSSSKGELLINGKHADYGDVTTPVNSYWENNFGLYNMSGNVAEMIDEKGIAKGGSWKDIPEYLKIDASYKYDGNAQAFIGFRYFIEILEK